MSLEPPTKVFYDGQCQLCCACVEWVRRRVREGELEFVDVAGSRRGAGGFAAVGCADCAPDALRVLNPDGTSYEGADAVRELARRTGWGRWVGWTGWPGVRRVANWLYRGVAAHRYRLGGWLLFRRHK